MGLMQTKTLCYYNIEDTNQYQYQARIGTVQYIYNTTYS